MRKKPRVLTVLCILLMLSGLGVMLYPTLCDRYTQWKLSQEIGQYNQVAAVTKKNYDELWEPAEAYNRYLAEKDRQFVLSEEEAQLIPTLLNPLGNTMLGYIEIPSIYVQLPIYQGTDDRSLQDGAGWWIGSSLPTGGPNTHCVLTAHTGLVKSKMFTDIDRLEPGDTFTLTILDRKLTYRVDKILITEPEDISNLYIQKGRDLVTLYTCYPYGENTQRLLVRGTRISLSDSQPHSGSDQSLTGGQSALLALALLIFLRQSLPQWVHK